MAKFLTPLVRLAFASPDTGAITSLFAATAKVVKERPEEYKGRYLVPYGKVGKAHRVVQDKVAARNLWETTRSEVNKYLQANGLEPLPA